MIQDETRISRADGLAAAEMDGETVLMDVGAGRYFHLDEVGSDIWRALEETRTLRSLLDHLQDRYDVDEETCRTDTTDLLRLLKQRGLVQLQAP